jgi:hypothetical protein
MHIEGPGRILSCEHTAHTDEQFTDCLARQWGVSVPKLIAMLAALVLSHTELAATRDGAAGGMEPLLPGLPGRSCHWCDRQLPPVTHHSRRYCPDRDCRRLAYNEWQRTGRPARGRSS